MSRRLADPPYLAFPLRIDRPADAPAGDLRHWPRRASRAQHIRGQIEEILFTLPGERVFRPEFGAGLRALLFEPNASPLWQVTQRRLAAALGDALTGEVDPRSLTIEVSGTEAELVIRIAYTLAAIGQREELVLSGGSH
ncbi:MAG: GPW/gp25 family protein [Candidatus Accumulibacter sp. UW26]|jgi:phage baseplate assembly protein W